MEHRKSFAAFLAGIGFAMMAVAYGAGQVPEKDFRAQAPAVASGSQAKLMLTATEIAPPPHTPISAQ